MTLIRKSNVQLDYISQAVHEMRTPLNIALFQINWLLKENMPKKQFNKLSSIWTSLDNLNTLVKYYFEMKLFDLNKIELLKSKIGINSFLKSYLKEVCHISKYNNISLNMQKDETIIWFDSLRIKQVLNNLISNAIKFSKKRWNISIKCEKNKWLIVIKIIDNWSWVKEKKDIFKKFISTDRSWLWFWLYLCKKIILLHKWKIWVKDNEGKGSIFYFSLPIR